VVAECSSAHRLRAFLLGWRHRRWHRFNLRTKRTKLALDFLDIHVHAAPELFERPPRLLFQFHVRAAARRVVFGFGQRVMAELDPLIDAQLEHAKGAKHLMLRDEKTGKFERIADERQIDAAIATGKAFWVFTKDPSIQAFTDLMNRAIDKPTEQVDLTITQVRRLTKSMRPTGLLSLTPRWQC
jgi:hypothetical protein